MKLLFKLMREAFDARQRPEPWGKGYSIGFQDGFEDGWNAAIAHIQKIQDQGPVCGAV